MITEVYTEAGHLNGFYDSFAKAGVLRDYWDDDLLKRLQSEIPSPDDARWAHIDTEHEKMAIGSTPSMWGRATRSLLTQMFAEDFVTMLEELTGIDGLYPHTIGGGYRQLEAGGFQGIHLDKSPGPFGWQRLYVEVFLDNAWHETDGGELITYNNPEPFPETGTVLPSSRALRIAVPPTLNNTAIVETSGDLFYGVPVPVAGDAIRQSVVVYYYSEEPPDDYTSPHETIWWGV